MDKIIFTEFGGIKTFILGIKRKNDKVILFRRWQKNIQISLETLRRLEKLGDYHTEYNVFKKEKVLIVHFRANTNIIQEKEGKMILDINKCIDKKVVLEIIERNVEHILHSFKQKTFDFEEFKEGAK